MAAPPAPRGRGRRAAGGEPKRQKTEEEADEDAFGEALKGGNLVLLLKSASQSLSLARELVATVWLLWMTAYDSPLSTAVREAGTLYGTSVRAAG